MAKKTASTKRSASPKASKPKSAKPKAPKAKPAPKAPKPPKPAKQPKPAKAPKVKPAPKAPKPAKAPEKPKAVATPAPEAKPARKGITIVTPKPPKKVKVPVTAASIMPPGVGPLIDPKNPNRRPLIPSGPKASAGRALGQHGGPEAETAKIVVKTHLSKKELDHFRALLLKKRHELVGDVSGMERAALQGESGSLSNMPSHLAEQGSDASEQSLSLDLAAADRRLIREIDDALKRIDEGTYGVCEVTGKPIKAERLEELPWARYSVEAARELERHVVRA